MLIPSQVILTYVRPSFWLPGLEIVWGVLTGLIAMATHAKQVYVLRVFLGLCESSAWPGMMTLLSKSASPSGFKSSYRVPNALQCTGTRQLSWQSVWDFTIHAKLSAR